MKRKKILNDLINYRKSIDDLKKNLKDVSWDSDTELVVLKSKHLKQMFKLFITGKIKENVLEEWANLIEGREDIRFENDDIKNIIFKLANPVLYGGINLDKVREYNNILESQEEV